MKLAYILLMTYLLSYQDIPGGIAGVWTDNGACFAKSVPTANIEPAAAVTEAKATPAAGTEEAPVIAPPEPAAVATSARRAATPAVEKLNSPFFKL